jgi:hypothetical protein
MDGHAVLVPEFEGKPVYEPRHTECLDVAAALALSCAIVATRGGMLPHCALPQTWVQAGTVVVGTALIMRAIGDFRFVGFFKRVRDTPFAEWDTRLFSPVSLMLGIATLWVALN